MDEPTSIRTPASAVSSEKIKLLRNAIRETLLQIDRNSSYLLNKIDRLALGKG
jgi:hypothetical protein